MDVNELMSIVRAEKLDTPVINGVGRLHALRKLRQVEKSRRSMTVLNARRAAPPAALPE